METLTIKQALQKGYVHCAHDNGDSFQSLMVITDLDNGDFISTDIVLAEKEGKSPSMSSDDIRQMIADTCESNHGNDTGDDTEQVYNTIMGLDFTATADMVNKALSEIVTYKLTKIKLIP